MMGEGGEEGRRRCQAINGVERRRQVRPLCVSRTGSPERDAAETEGGPRPPWTPWIAPLPPLPLLPPRCSSLIAVSRDQSRDSRFEAVNQEEGSLCFLSM
ncbi:hypothetical protein FQA47_017099 [Oryzias melastigma]|uniref:Uncharacterized protein n=1 Tax=Oryzias melastigma TaxID=30732 RepID=A0A834C606_ORYME|nr:hypothetical protein FQA47_017099 [Oryzias melastigma]